MSEEQPTPRNEEIVKILRHYHHMMKGNEAYQLHERFDKKHEQEAVDKILAVLGLDIESTNQ